MNKTLVVVDDHTRPTNIKMLLKRVLGSFDIIVATGTHKSSRIQEMQRIDPHPFTIHNLNEVEEYKGFWINKKVLSLEYEKIVCIGSIWPHATFGFSGGVKAIIPGLAGLETISYTHWRALDYEMGEILGNFDNEVRKEAVKLIKRIGKEITIINEVGKFILQSGTFPMSFETHGVFVGDMEDAHKAGCELSLKINSVPISKKSNIVIANVFDTSETLRQAIKGICSADLACKDGGFIILEGTCNMGVAPQFPVMEQYGFSDPEKVYRMAERGEIDKISAYTLVAIGKIIKRKPTILVAPGIPKDMTEHLGFIYARNREEALQRARRKYNEDPIYLYPAGLIIPKIID